MSSRFLARVTLIETGDPYGDDPPRSERVIDGELEIGPLALQFHCPAGSLRLFFQHINVHAIASANAANPSGYICCQIQPGKLEGPADGELETVSELHISSNQVPPREIWNLLTAAAGMTPSPLLEGRQKRVPMKRGREQDDDP